MSSELAVLTKQLKKIFNGREVIRGCNMTVEKGSIYGFVGKNGAGKATVIKLLLGLLKPTTGEVAVLNLNPAKDNLEIYIYYFDCNDNAGKLTLLNKKYGGIRQKMNLIFLHGLGQSPSSWNETLSLLPRYATAYCLDLFDLCMDNKRVYENVYSAFKKYADGFGEPINLCGISLGAVLALNYAIDNPQRVASLILIAPQYKMPRLLLSIQSMVFHLLPKRAFQKIGFNKKDMISMANSMRLLNFTPMLKNIVCPVLIVCGDRDISNKKASKALAKNISGTQLSFVENAGHEVNVDAPAKLADLIKQFCIGNQYLDS